MEQPPVGSLNSAGKHHSLIQANAEVELQTIQLPKASFKECKDGNEKTRQNSSRRPSSYGRNGMDEIEEL